MESSTIFSKSRGPLLLGVDRGPQTNQFSVEIINFGRRSGEIWSITRRFFGETGSAAALELARNGGDSVVTLGLYQLLAGRVMG